MKRTTQPGFHRHVFREAWHLTKQRPALWLLAVFAGTAMSGAAVEPVVGSFLRTNRWVGALDGRWMMDGAAWLESAGLLVKNFCQVNQTALQIWMFALVIMGLIALAFTIWCQTGLIAGLLHKQKPTLSEALHHGWEHFWTLLLANVMARASQFVLAVAAGFPVILYLVRPNFWETFSASLAMVSGLILGTCGWILALLSSIRAVQKEEPLHNALAWSWRILREKPLMLLETALLLAGSTALLFLGFTIILVGAGLILTVLWAILGSGTWLPGAAFVGAVGTVGFSLLFLLGFGAVTTFRYAVWVRIYDRFNNHLVRKAAIPKTHRLFHPKHIR